MFGMVLKMMPCAFTFGLFFPPTLFCPIVVCFFVVYLFSSERERKGVGLGSREDKDQGGAAEKKP